MITILISGEGNSDIGEIDGQDKFKEGPITVLTRKIFYWNHKNNIEFKFIPRSKLKKYPMTLKGRKKNKTCDEINTGHSVLAYKLACNAMDENIEIAILMRDADNNDFDKIYCEINSGFRQAMFDRGIAAIPKPQSESWVICAIDYEYNDKIEKIKNDLKELLKEILELKGYSYNKDNVLKLVTDCNVSLIKCQSFMKFKNDIECVVKYLH